MKAPHTLDDKKRGNCRGGRWPTHEETAKDRNSTVMITPTQPCKLVLIKVAGSFAPLPSFKCAAN